MKIKPEHRLWYLIYGSTALIMLIAMSVFGWLVYSSKEETGTGRVAGARPTNTASNPIPDERFDLLATFQAPQYPPDPGAPKAFQAAMAQYANQDYPKAATALRTVADAKPDFAEARFYLGISLLLSNNRIEGIQELRTLTAGGDNPYLERARFYLAKGLIAEHDTRRAQEQLQQVIAQHGDFETQAAALLSQIRPAS